MDTTKQNEILRDIIFRLMTMLKLGACREVLLHLEPEELAAIRGEA